MIEPRRRINALFNVAQLIVMNLVIIVMCLNDSEMEARQQMPLLIHDDSYSRLIRQGKSKLSNL